MKILYVASEALPFIASGGLGDVAGSLPTALCGEGHDCRVILPLYSNIKKELRESLRFFGDFTIKLSWRNVYCGVFTVKKGAVTYYLIDNEQYFKRDRLYGYDDDGERFAFFSKAVLEALRHIDFKPDIVHCNDWQTALIPIYYKYFYERQHGFPSFRTVFTIHNIQYQGIFSLQVLEDVFDIPFFAKSIVEFDGSVNLMKGALQTADRITTVSETYAKELCDPWYAHGLDGFICSQQNKFSGIINGIDTELYNPGTDRGIAQNYSEEDLSGKAQCKKDLISEFNLPFVPGRPAVAMVTRLVAHKGIDLVRYIFDELLSRNLSFLLLGSGDREFEEFFKEMQYSHPEKVGIYLGFEPGLAKKIYAGADFFLMPSQSEPCGLAQMVAARYGTIPIVRKTGGLADSITDFGTGKGNGFTFESYNAHDMLGAIDRALGLYLNKPLFANLVHSAMTTDFSWKKSAQKYTELYELIV